MIRDHRWVTRLGSVLIAICALVVTALLCEATLRLIRPHDNVHRTATQGIYAPDSELGWVLRPNLRHTRDWVGRSVTILTDRHGHRIAEGDVESADVAKIVFAGDSFVFGNEVNAEETFVHLTGKAVGPGRAAINLGVGAYFLSQECLSLRRYLASDTPVASAFLGLYIGNDLEAGAYPPKTMGVDDGGYLRPRAGTDLESLILRNSRLAFTLYGAWSLHHPEESSKPSEIPLAQKPIRRRWIYDPSAFMPGRIDEHRRVLQALRDDARRRAVPVTVVLIPERDQVYGWLDDLPNRTLTRALAALGMPVVDLLPRMRSATAEGAALYNEVVGGHLSPQGHRLVAEILIEHL